MAIRIDEYHAKLEYMERTLHKRMQEAKVELDKYGDLPALQAHLEMVKAQKHKVALQGGFDRAPTKAEGSRVWYDDNGYGDPWDAKGDGPFKLTAAQRLAMEEKKRMEEFERSKKATKRRKDLLEAPHNACTLSVAVNLWIVKFGDGWVRVNDLPDGNVKQGELDWTRMLARLTDAGKVEKLEDYVRVIT